MAHSRSTCQLAWNMKNTSWVLTREWHRNYNISEYQWFLFCLYCMLSTSIWGGAWRFSCLAPQMNLHHFWGLWSEKNKLESLALAVKWRSLHCWKELNLWLLATPRSQCSSTMEWVESYDDYHKEYSTSKHLKGVAWKLHTAVLFTCCKSELRHTITLAKTEAGGYSLYSCHSD